MKRAQAVATCLLAVAAGTTPAAILDTATAAGHTTAHYLAQGPEPWQPADLRKAQSVPPTHTVAADGSGSHRSVQAAIDALPAAGSTAVRTVIRIMPGTYRERLCLRDKAPVLLVGAGADASTVRIVEARHAGQAKRAGIDPAQPCHANLTAAVHGTSGSATVIVHSHDVQLARLSIENDANTTGLPPDAGAQAVALLTRGDRVQLHDVRLISHQDTFYVRRPEITAPARVHVSASLIAGDVDFVFGNATLVVEGSTLLSRAGRRSAGQAGPVLAPSTPPGVAYGFLVTGSRFAAEPGVAAGGASLGRAWDEAVPRGAWQPGVSPNGQALVRDSSIGPHITARSAATAARWSASTSARAATASGSSAHRLAEFNNTDDADDWTREVLPAAYGWAAGPGGSESPGTRGGADALPADVNFVDNRNALLQALRPHPRPRIVRVQGHIHLAADEAGQALGAAAFADPAFNWPDYERAYNPATWGRQPPAGALEEARRRSAQRQAEHITVRVPSGTTLVGVDGADGQPARISGGMLLLQQVQDVIVRNLHLSDAYDHFPAWDPRDNSSGEWNSEYDNLSLRGARRVWIDHCTFDDGLRPDSSARMALGRRMQHHDGLLDITRLSDLVTVSWNLLQLHSKTTLVGGSDSQTADADHLRVSFFHNHWDRVHERAPRVRYGQVHVMNNLYTLADAPAENSSHGYSIGVGHRSAIVSEHNAWVGPATRPRPPPVRALNGEALADSGSVYNGLPVDLLAELQHTQPQTRWSGNVGWRPRLAPPPDDAREVPALVRQGAGAGRLQGHASAAAYTRTQPR